jgi:Tfp pilus assembly protein PilF
MSKGEYDKALADLNQAIAIDPTKAGFYDSRAKAYWALHNGPKAMQDKKKASEVDHHP